MITGTAAAFLLLVGVWVPYLAWKSARKVGRGPLPMSRHALFGQVLLTQAFLLAIALVAARQNGIALFTLPGKPLIAWAAAAIALVVMLAMLRFRWPGRSHDDKARLDSMLPHDASELRLYTLVALAAGIVEEIVYRGVMTTLLARLTGSFVVAAILSAAVFAWSHIVQGRRAMMAIFFIALLAQALVTLAGSLVPVMALHALYDLVAGIVVPRWYGRDSRTQSLTSSPPAAATEPDR